jgi:hypothetical protein
MESQDLSVWDPAGAPLASSPELRALLACAQAVIDRGRVSAFREALASCPSPDRLCDMAVEQGMLGQLDRLLSTEVGKDVDPSLVRKIRGLQRKTAKRTLRQTAYLLRLLERLDAGGVQAMLIKGPLWAERLYGDLSLRSWCDLDLLVRHEQVPAAREVLLGSGFLDANPFNDRIARSRLGGPGQIALLSVEQGVCLELHWKVTVGVSRRSLRPEDVFARAERVELLGREVACPSKTDVFLISCLNGTRDRWNSVERLLGLGVQVRGRPEGEWPGLLDGARRAHCLRRAVIGVSHVCRALGLETPKAVETALAGDGIARRLIDTLRPEELQGGGGSSAKGELAKLLWGFVTEDRARFALGHAAARFFRPGPEDWQTVPLPKGTRWLHYPLRPLRLGWKWCRRVFRSGWSGDGRTVGL